jgi:MFS transporter, FHS family, glucose/mannose:H+ symporter
MKVNSKFKIILTFVSIGMMTSGLSTFVMQAVHYYHVSPSSAGTLESYMSFSKMIVSLFLFSFLIKAGFKKSIIVTYSALVIFCFFMPIWDSIWSLRVFLIFIGICFISVKTITYSSVSLITNSKKEHAAFINLMEAIYTVGSFSGMWIYAFFIKTYPTHWTYVFWFFCFTCGAILLLWIMTPFNETKIEDQEKKSFLQQYEGFGIICSLIFWLFLILMLTHTMLEVGLGSWLPSFNKEILGLSPSLSVQIASFLVIGIALGRFIGVFVVKYIKWYNMIFINYVISLILIILIVTHIQTGVGKGVESIFQAPIIAFGIPLLGIFIGPVYPTLVSTILTSRPSCQHAALISLIMIVGPAADSICSKVVGIFFGNMGGLQAFYISGITAIVLFLIFVYPYKRAVQKSSNQAFPNV